ncbi:MAG: alpha/beta fold hydrolase [Deltaproteobacteria bacterium]|nr:alpha/beta fold hydrolase [Deltaproteobacteria bacterium]
MKKNEKTGQEKKRGLLPQAWNVPREFGSGLALLGLSFLGQVSRCNHWLDGGRPVVYLHGTGVGSGSLGLLRYYQAAKGHGAGFAFDYDTNADFDDSAFGLLCFLDKVLEQAPPGPGEPLTLIGHSLGGLIIRRYLQLYPNQHPVKRVFLISTPNYGTHLAHYFPTAVTCAMLPDSKFLAELNDGSHIHDKVHYVSLYGDKDLFVLPRESMRLDGSECVVIPGLGHNNIVLSPALMAEIEMRLTPGYEENIRPVKTHHGQITIGT